MNFVNILVKNFLLLSNPVNVEYKDHTEPTVKLTYTYNLWLIGLYK